MRIAIYSRRFDRDLKPHFSSMFTMLNIRNVEVWIWKNTLEELKTLGIDLPEHTAFDESSDLSGVSLLISIGGDGTMLDTVEMTAEKGIPVLGINTGRLGFLSNTQVEDAEDAVNAFLDNKHIIEERSLLELKSPQGLFEHTPVALNEIAIHKHDTSSMITIHAYLDGEFLNSYWADGLIISTPTGSTAYSLSCGGPIIDPRSRNFVITPIAPHNLNVRPFVVRDNGEITLKVDGRDGSYLLSMDSRSVDLDENIDLKIALNDTGMRLVTFEGQDFLNTLRQKLSWGLDQRN